MLRTFEYIVVVAWATLAIDGQVALAQLPSGWKAHDWDRPTPPVVTPGKLRLPVEPPSDAVILFDGENLDAWRDGEGNAAKWIVRDDYMESVPDAGYIYTAQGFGDVQLHLEWAAPAPPQGTSQGRGNSGVFLMGKFEIQVLDSYDNRTYADGQAGSIYGQFPPLVNAALPPGEWQSYDIIFRRPRFAPEGDLEQPARITVLHNNVLVQDAAEPWGGTSWLQYTPYSDQPDRLPIGLQDHGNPVRYRNIWLRELDEHPYPRPPRGERKSAPIYNKEFLAKYAGRYGGWEDDDLSGWTIELDDGKLFANVGSPMRLELIPRSPTEFDMRYTAAKLTFDLNDAGEPIAVTFHLAADKRHAERRPDKPKQAE